MRTLLVLMLSYVMCALVASVAVAEESVADDRPNFLLITSEDMSPNLGIYGDPNATTPNLDRLARHGNRYSAAFANGPICSPARTALLFSKYQTSLGAGNHRSVALIDDDLVGFAAELRKAGYFCTNHPKVDYNVREPWGVERATYDRGRDWRAAGRDGRPFLSIINLAISHQSATSVWPHEQYRREVRAKLPPELLHDPDDMVVPGHYPDTAAERTELARYSNCVTLMDRQAGEILDRLEVDGLADDTIVMYFSDHGNGMPRGKSTPFASGLRVPLIVYCPPKYEHLLRAPVGGVVDDVVEFIDIGPTLLHLAGVQVPGHMHGLPFLGDSSLQQELGFGALDRRGESFNLARTVSDGRYVYIRAYMPHIPIGQPKGYGFPSAIYQELHRLHRRSELTGAAGDFMKQPPIEMLFDLHSDPDETVNLIGSSLLTEVVARLRAAHQTQIREFADLNFVPEEILAARAGERPWHDLADELPLEDIYSAADLVGRGEGVVDEQIALLDHDDAVVRWWAVIGLRSQSGSDPVVVRALAARLTDSSATVRIEAAAALLAADRDHSEALTVLLTGIASEDPRVSHRAAREAQLLRLNDDTFAAAIASAAQRHRTEWIREVNNAIIRQRATLE
ncbi:MAG: sulfatase-like hydrolase/transferase [Planctomycetota bacterium]